MISFSKYFTLVDALIKHLLPQNGDVLNCSYIGIPIVQIGLNNCCPRYNNLETTIHIIRDCPWAKRIWYQSLGILPLSFFHLSLQNWLHTNATSDFLIFHYQLPWKSYFPFLCWHLRLARMNVYLKINIALKI